LNQFNWINWIGKPNKKEMKDGKCEYLMWGNLYMPDGFLFEFTPDLTNVPFLNMLRGGTFKNSRYAIILN